MKKRKTSLLCCILGGWFGLHKFYEGDFAKGTVYFCTAGLFFIGWILDIIAYAKMQEEEYNPREGREEKKKTKKERKEELYQVRQEIAKRRQEKLRNRICPRCGSSNHHAFVEQKEIISGKTKTRYTMNLNPLRPFTLVNKKEKIVRNPITRQVSKFVCDDCGAIFK